jgi:hypothetical protein
MKNGIAVATMLVMLTGAAVAQSSVTNATLTAGGVTYTNAVFVRVNPWAATYKHNTGIASIPLAQLPAELQQKFGFDPVKAAQYRGMDNAAQQRYLVQDAAARAKREGQEHQAALDADAAARQAASDAYLGQARMLMGQNIAAAAGEKWAGEMWARELAADHAAGK